MEADAEEPLGNMYLAPSLPVADATPWQNLALEVVRRLSQGEVSSPGFLSPPPSANKRGRPRESRWLT